MSDNDTYAIRQDIRRIADAQERQAKAAEEQAENVAWIGDLIHEFWSWLPDNESSIPLFSSEEGEDSGEGRHANRE